MEYTQLELAEAFLHAGELDDALDALNNHLASSPTDENARRTRAQVLTRIGVSRDEPHQLNAALADLNAIQSPSTEDITRRVNVLLQLGDKEAAYRLLIETWANKAHTKDPRILELLLESLYQRAESAYAIEILFDQPKTSRWLRWTGDFHALKGDHRVALEYFCSALDQLEESTQDANPISEGFINNLRGQLILRRAEVHTKLALYEEAEVDYTEAGTLIPSDPMISFLRGIAIYHQGTRLEEAVTLCKNALNSTTSETIRAEMHTLLSEKDRYNLLINNIT